jgi:uncharacterized protein (DUF1800 family)
VKVRERRSTKGRGQRSLSQPAALLGAALLALGCIAILPAAPEASAQEAPGDSTQARNGTLNDRERAIHALSRLTFGAQPGQVDAVLKMGVDKWIEQQLDPASIADKDCDKRLAPLKSLGMSNRGLMDTYNPVPKNKTPEEQRRVNKLRQTPPRELQTSVLLRAVYSERQLQEVMVNFWRNHFNVDITKDSVRYFAVDYEREVIRKHVFGKFEDMLMASAKHPAMLIYLDNAISQKPLSADERKALERAGPNNKSKRLKKLERERGLNENYARELLELHTLGVDNYYKQRDVRELSRVLTGWTVDRRGGREKASYNFWFNGKMHDEYPKKVLRWTLKGLRGDEALQEGEAVIRRLALHKGTAQFLSKKLCQYLVHDEPEQEMIDRIAKVYLKTKGDLKEVTRAVVTDEAFWSRRAYRSKFKTPFEYAASMLRVVEAEIRNPKPVLEALKLMRQPVYRCEDPTGYYDTKEAWLDPGVLALRWQIALDFAEQPQGAVRIPARFFGRAPVSVSLEHWLGAQIVPHGLTGRTTGLIRNTVTHWPQDRMSLQRRITGLMLGSPEFQRQ